MSVAAGGCRGVIDIGTNTLLLLIVDAAMRPVVDACRFARLGQGLDASGALAPEAIARGLAICHEYRALLDAHGVARPVVVGTQALREAANAAAFVAPAEAVLGAPIEIIAGAREAELAFASVAHTFPELARAPYVVLDVGGGSSELIVTDGAHVTGAVSVPIGAVRMTERHLRHDPPGADEVAAMLADVDAHLARGLAGIAVPRGAPVVGTAGTATTLAALELALATYDAARVTGVRLAPATVEGWLARLLALPVAARRALPGLEPERADVIAGGVAVVARVLRAVDAAALITADRGVRWGLVYERAPA